MSALIGNPAVVCAVALVALVALLRFTWYGASLALGLLGPAEGGEKGEGEE